MQEYISIHVQILNSLLRKAIQIPNFFKTIDFGEHDDPGALLKELGELTMSDGHSGQDCISNQKLLQPDIVHWEQCESCVEYVKDEAKVCFYF